MMWTSVIVGGGTTFFHTDLLSQLITVQLSETLPAHKPGRTKQAYAGTVARPARPHQHPKHGGRRRTRVPYLRPRQTPLHQQPTPQVDTRVQRDRSREVVRRELSLADSPAAARLHRRGPRARGRWLRPRERVQVAQRLREVAGPVAGDRTVAREGGAHCRRLLPRGDGRQQRRNEAERRVRGVRRRHDCSITARHSHAKRRI